MLYPLRNKLIREKAALLESEGSFVKWRI